MYVLIVSRGYPSEKYKRNGIFEFDQAKALARAGCKVIFAVIDLRSIRRLRRFGRESFVKDKVQIEAINIPCGRAPRRLLYMLGRIGFSKLYDDIVKKYGCPDIIHAHFTDYAYIAAKKIKRNHIPLIVTEHSSNMNKDNIDKKLLQTAEFAYMNANRVIVVSNALAKKIEEHFSIKVLCVPNIVDTDLFTYKKAHNNKKFSIVSTGNLIPSKKMDILIEGFSKAFSENDDCILYIFGKGPEKRRLKRLIDKNNLQNKVFLMGECTRNQIARKMQESDCFVLVSERETFGVAYIEAMATGLPVIATDWNCNGEIVKNKKNGVLYPNDEMKDLRESILWLMKHSDEMFDMKVRCIQDAQKYQPDTYVKKMICEIEN